MREKSPTLPHMVFSQGEQFANRAVLRAKKSGLYTDILWKDLLVDIKKLGMALIDLGIEPQDRIAILSENRPEWVAADLSSLSIGAVTVPIYTSLTADEIGYILKDSNVKLVFISSPELMARILPLQEKLNLKFVLFHAPYRVSGPRIWWMGELLGLGDTAHPHTEQAFWDRLRSGTRNSLASIIYTSGTTGPPKGVMLSHGNFLSNCEAIYEALPIRENDQSLSFLPLSHVFERTAGYYFVLFAGGTISYAETLESVPQNLIETQPTIVTAVPRFYEKFHEKIMESVRQAPAIKRRIFSWALAVGRRWSHKKLEGSPLPFWLAFEHRIADRLVFSQLRHRLGGRLRFFISGGAPLSKELAEFFYSANVLIIEGYGLTETSPVITANRVDRFQFGTVGLPLPGVQIKIAEDGEILVQGPLVMQGYLNNPQATAEAIDSQGWFHTGDIGAITPEGFLKITDRKKDLIKTSGGKMVAPQNMEALLKSDPWISDCMIIGDKKKYISALIVPNFARVEAFAAKNHISSSQPADLIQQQLIIDLLWGRVQTINQKLASFEQVKKISLLAEPFTLQAGELTPTMKVKRLIIAERYAKQIEAMYRE